MKIGKKLRRVDVQVSIITVFLTLICTFSMYLHAYFLTYTDMINSLEDRVTAIHGYLEDNLDKETFLEINARQDVDKECYGTMKELLESVKQATNVRYLYTAKKNDKGEFIYVVDGLDSNAEDFRYPGDPIEPEICGDMQRALEGETVLPDEIKKTDWGKIFITYFPIHDRDEVIGVLGIEFEAGHQYETYRNLRGMMPVMIVAVSLISTVIAMLLFRRISNPTYKDLYNTDHLTGLKNRNSFEVDLYNLDMEKKRQNVGIIEADLNNLKMVNDKLGHIVGDAYIKAAGEAIQAGIPKTAIAYRMGGDEYTVLLRETSQEEMEEICSMIGKCLKVRSNSISKEIPLSISLGHAVYNPEKDAVLMDVCRRADARMYEQKERFHSRQDSTGK